MFFHILQMLAMTTGALSIMGGPIPAFPRTITVELGSGTRSEKGLATDNTFTQKINSDGGAEYNTESNGVDFHIGALGHSVHCWWEGTTSARHVTFKLSNSDNYLNPCGPNEGITMICHGPDATCKN